MSSAEDRSALPCSTSVLPSSESAAGGATGSSESSANRSIVVDASFFEEQFLRCQVCQERFHATERPPKSLPCNHTFCVACLTQIFNHAQPASRRNLLWADDALDGPLKCPTCRVEIFVSKNKIKDLPNDHRVIQMIDFLSQAVSTSKNVCMKHERQPLNFFCKKCLLPVCRDCTVLDHKEQQGHHIVDVKEALSDRSGEFNQVEEQCRQMLERMKARSDALASASKRLDIQERQLKNEIKETFIEYRLLLEKRQEALTQTLQQTNRDQKALINTRFVYVCEHGTQLQKLFDAFTKAKDSNDVEQLFNLHKQMKDTEAQFHMVAAGQDTELFKSCTFDSESEGVFLSGISSLGEVKIRDDPNLKEPVSAHQLLYLDNEDRRERERLLQYEMSAQAEHSQHADYQPDLDDDDAYDMHDDNDIDMELRRQQAMSRDEDFELQRVLAAYRRHREITGGQHGSREDMDQEPSPSSRPVHPRRRPRSSQGSTSNLLGILSQLQQPPEPSARSGSRSRRSTREGSGGSGVRTVGYRVERHTNYPDDSN